MHSAATAQGGVTEVKEEFQKFQQAHTPESPKPPPQPLFSHLFHDQKEFFK